MDSTANGRLSAVTGNGGTTVSTVRKGITAWCLLLAISLAAALTEAAEHEQVSAGAYHTVVLKRSGTVWTWGSRLPGWAQSQVKGPGEV